MCKTYKNNKIRNGTINVVNEMSGHPVERTEWVMWEEVHVWVTNYIPGGTCMATTHECLFGMSHAFAIIWEITLLKGENGPRLSIKGQVWQW